MAVQDSLPSRQPSQRLAARGKPRSKGRSNATSNGDISEEALANQYMMGNGDYDDHAQQQGVNLYPGINDMADALEALPMEIIRHFTLLKEIDAKCIVTMPELTRLIKYLFTLPVPKKWTQEQPAGGPEEAALIQEREQVLAQIRQLICELMPCLEEKMHVAGVAADAIARHVKRLDYDFDELIVGQDEIPHSVRFGPADHPAFLPIVTPAEAKMAQSSRSESRREAMAAKKAAAAAAAAAKADGPSVGEVGNGKTQGTESRSGRGAPVRPDADKTGSKSGNGSTGPGNGSAAAGSGSAKQGSSSAKQSSSSSAAAAPANKRRKVASSGAVGSPQLGGGATVYGTGVGGGHDGGHEGHDPVSVKQEYHGEDGNDEDGPQNSNNKRSRSGGVASSSRKRAAIGNGSTPTPGNESSGSGRSSRAAAKAAAAASEGESGTRNGRGTRSIGRRSANSAAAGGSDEAEEEVEQDDDEGNGEDNNENEEQVYCYCQQVSFGAMVGCDGADCKIEWFHLPCIGLSQPPVGQWFCKDCEEKRVAEQTSRAAAAAAAPAASASSGSAGSGQVGSANAQALGAPAAPTSASSGMTVLPPIVGPKPN